MVHCRFYPITRDEIENCGGTCMLGSELGSRPCTWQDEEKCQLAKDEKEADQVIRRNKDEQGNNGEGKSETSSS
jgi:hypothetical protein